jgi:transcriptional regulator with XRE-family HTH domain
MAKALAGVKKSPPAKSHIHRFEAGTREPSLLVLLEYSKIAGIPLETLVDDEFDLPPYLAPERGGQWVIKFVKTNRLRSP